MICFQLSFEPFQFSFYVLWRQNTVDVRGEIIIISIQQDLGRCPDSARASKCLAVFVLCHHSNNFERASISCNVIHKVWSIVDVLDLDGSCGVELVRGDESVS